MVKPFLLISRVYQTYIVYLARMSSKWVEGPNYVCHFTPWILMTIGSHLLAQTNIKHLLTLYQNAIFDLFHSSPRPLLFTTTSPSPPLVPGRFHAQGSNDGGGRTAFFFPGQQFSLSLSTPPLLYWFPKASNAISTLFTPSQSPQTQVGA